MMVHGFKMSTYMYDSNFKEVHKAPESEYLSLNQIGKLNLNSCQYILSSWLEGQEINKHKQPVKISKI
jgi:hypothetical protein